MTSLKAGESLRVHLFDSIMRLRQHKKLEQ